MIRTVTTEAITAISHKGSNATWEQISIYHTQLSHGPWAQPLASYSRVSIWIAVVPVPVEVDTVVGGK